MAIGASTFSDISGAVGDLFAASGDQTKAAALRLKAQGDELEGENYGMAATLAGQNEKYTELSTAIQQTQLQREQTMAIGGTRAQIGGAGLSASGSSLDVLADSAKQASLSRAVLGQQGLITEAGYTEQQASYQNMQKAAGLAEESDLMSADAADKAATGSTIAGVIKGVAGVASLFTGGLSDTLMSGATAIGGLLGNSAGDALQDTVQDMVE